MEEILIYLETVKDPRQEWKVVHALKDIVALVLLGLLANADDWQEIEIFGRANEEMLREYIPLQNGIPSHDTLQRVMSMVQPETLAHLQTLWNTLLDSNEGEKLKKLLSIDGKTMRGNGNKNQDALHVVSAWSKENGVCFGQVATEGKGKEIAGIKSLLDILQLRNQIVSIDAIGTQTEIVEKIRAGKGDYVLAVKGNQATLHEDIRTYFQDETLRTEVKAHGGYHSTVEKARGQIERRSYYQTDDITWLKTRKEWKGLKSIGMVRTVCEKDGKQSVEERYFISSLAQDVELFAQCVRGHWSVESMHWHLDVTFREDQNRTLEKTAALNLNILRKLALSILKLIDLGKARSLKKKRFAIGCGFARNLKLLMGL